MNRRAFIALATLSVLAGSAAAETTIADPFLGTWVFDPQQSRYESDIVPSRMVIVMSATAEGVHYRSETWYADDRSAVSEYTAAYGGDLAMVTGSTGLFAPVSLKRIDASTVEASYFLGLRVVARARRAIGSDDRVMTITTVSSDAHGQNRTNIAVFQRAAAPTAES